MLPSSKLGFLNVKTDGRRKHRHNEEVLFVARLLQGAGITDYCLHHVNDAGMNKNLPLCLDNKWYDISYVAPDGEVFLIEIMRVRTARGDAVTEEGLRWLKGK